MTTLTQNTNKASEPSSLRIPVTTPRPLVQPAGNRNRFYLGLRRTGDIVGASLLLILFSPILATVWVVLWFTTGGKPMFAQTRVGECGRHFSMLKFRTMRLDAEKVQAQVQNQHDNGPIFKNRQDPRITWIGRFLRSTSIDEMPQLFNVLQGHMTLVGPRPPIPREVEQYKAWQLARLSIKPGLTCLWQVSGRSEIGFDDWCRMDIWYMRNQNVLTDANLLWKTPLSVLSRRGAY